MTAPSSPYRVAVHRSLLTRLLLVSLLIAVTSIASTAWLAVTSTTRALQQEQGQALAGPAHVYDTLMAYAATHPGWAGVQGTLDDLARQEHRGIRLTTTAHAPISVSRETSGSIPTQPTAVIDPLNVVPSLVPAAGTSQIDPRAVGPYRLSRGERDRMAKLAEKIAGCLTYLGTGPSGQQNVTVELSPSGRAHLNTSRPPDEKAVFACRPSDLDTARGADSTALESLNRSIAACLGAEGIKPVQVNLQFTALTGSKAHAARIQACIATSRRAQLNPYVAPAALLFINSPSAIAPSRFTLSASNVRRIVLVTALVLLLTMALTVLVGLRLVRPLRALIRTLRRPDADNVRVPVVSNDEIGSLATAFNELSARRERLEDQRRAMISDIAHELRTPLSNVRGWLQAAEDNITARDQTLTASLLEEALHLQRIIDDLQDLAQADAGELRLQRESLQLGELLALIAHTHRGQADMAGVGLLTEAPAGLFLEADPTRLRQAIANLVSNAIRHTPAGGTVTVRGHRSGADVRIDVMDTGSGIGAQDLPQVFDRFWRADKSRSRASGGSGLGLAITRQFVQAHGGRISVRSDPGRETVFSILLPAAGASALT